MSEPRQRTWHLLQVLLLFAAWLFLCWLHWDNDGLWFGDAPRHAANGLLWKDYLQSLSLDPMGYALSYYARYPTISPTSYPPAFYLLEAVFFGAFGPSPYVAKGLVLGFVLLATLYTTAWCRRWIDPDAGWGGMLLLLLPGVIMWSHAIMLNVPALALNIAALYHLRRWLESPSASPAWRHGYVGAALAVMSILTYLPSCVIVLIAAVWLILERRLGLLWSRKALITSVISVLMLLPWAVVSLKFEKNRVMGAMGTTDYLKNVSQWQWVYYLERLPELFGTHLLVIAAFGILGGMLVRRWRHETVRLLTMTAVCFAFFSYMRIREGRYLLLLSLPIACFCFLGVFSMVRCMGKLTSMQGKWTRTALLVTVSLLIISQILLALSVYVPSVSGFEQVVDYLKTVAPDEPVFYDGHYPFLFAFYVRAADPDFRRQVVPGRKLLYAEALYRGGTDFVSSALDVVDTLQKRGGCRWIVVADRPDNTKVAAPQYLRDAVKGPEFELVKSFPITRKQTKGVKKTNVNVYRFLVPVEPVDEIDMPFFSLGENARYRIKPIQR